MRDSYDQGLRADGSDDPPEHTMKAKVSFIDFLNSVPLGWGFLYGPYRDVFELVFDVPSECARHLARGEVEVGLIPTIEYQNIPDLRVLPDIAIASKHEVKSVLFVSKSPLEQVKRVAVDSSSRTSVVLLKILLEHFHGKDSVSYCEELPDPRRMLELYDAALLIGNPALKVSRQSLYVYDLAREWNRFTGLPFVFAFWAVRPEVDLGEEAKLFSLSRDQGLKEIDSIAKTYSRKLAVPAAEIRDYLATLNYSLDEANLRGLQTFFELAGKLALISTPRPIQFHE